MPRRRALTEAQIEALLALPTAEPDLIRYDTLSPADLAVIARRRRPHNRLGFAVQLCALRFPGRLLRPGEVVPREVLSFIADQLDLDPDILADADLVDTADTADPVPSVPTGAFVAEAAEALAHRYSIAPADLVQKLRFLKERPQPVQERLLSPT